MYYGLLHFLLIQHIVIDLCVVFELRHPLEARVERLTATLMGISIALQQLTTLLRQNHGMVAATGYSNGLDQALLAKVSEVARPRIGGRAGVIRNLLAGTTRNEPTVESMRAPPSP